MLVLMRVAQTWQHAGSERPLNVGVEYDLPDLVAAELLRGGAAVAVRRAPETKPAAMPLETKRGRR